MQPVPMDDENNSSDYTPMKLPNCVFPTGHLSFGPNSKAQSNVKQQKNKAVAATIPITTLSTHSEEEELQPLETFRHKQSTERIDP